MLREKHPQQIKAEFIEKMGSQIGSMYHVLYNDVIWLHIKWQVYLALYGKSETRINLLNESSPTFFYMVQEVLWDDILIHLCRLMDPVKTSKNKDNLTLKSLENAFPNTEMQEAKRLLEEAESHILFARQWRNKRIAHRDLLHSLGLAAVPLTEVHRMDIESALFAIRGIMTLMYKHYIGNDLKFDLVSDNNSADALVYHLRLSKQIEKFRKERLLKGQPLPEDFIDPPEA